MTGHSKNKAIVLAAMPGTQKDIVQRTGLGRATVHRWCCALRSDGLCHVGAWRRHPGGGPFAEVYRAGAGVDVPCEMIATTDQERCRAYHQRLRKSGEMDHVLAAQRGRYWASKPATRDPLTAALFGCAGVTAR